MSREDPADTLPRGLAMMARLREQPNGGEVFLWWLGQSGFTVRCGREMLAIDPYLSDSLTRKYAGSANPHVRISDIVVEPHWLAQSLLTAISASHHHTDHLDPDTLGPIMSVLRRYDATIPLIAPAAWKELAAERAGIEPTAVVEMDDGLTTIAGAFRLTGIAAAHPTLDKDDRGRCKYLGYVVECGRWRIYHSGDTVVYPGMVERLRPFNVDVAILPINGKVGNMGGRDAARLAKDIGAKLVIPCHYEMFEFNTADPRDEFIPECGRIGQPYKVLRAGERLTLGG